MAIAVVMAGFGGCHRGPPVQHVEGAVLLDGVPVADCTVGFTPVGGGLPAVGRTGPDGGFRITAVRGGRDRGGTTVGTYVVTATKMELLPFPPNPDGVELQPAVRHLVPEAYGDPRTSPLRATVRLGRNRGPEFRFDLRPDFRVPPP